MGRLFGPNEKVAMTTDDIISTAIGWPLILIAAVWWVKKKKSPKLSTFRAFCGFVGVLGGGTAVLLFAVVFSIYFFRLEGQGQIITGALAAPLCIGVLIPLWRLANRLIANRQ
jgi:hypothetical protein